MNPKFPFLKPGCYIKGDMEPTEPKGDIGPQGKEEPPESLDIPTAIFFKFNENTKKEEIKSLARLPFNVKIGDEDNSYFVLNQEDATITFLKSGTYYVHFVVLAHLINETQYKNDHDMIAIGFTKVVEDRVYAGSSMWDNNKETPSIIGSGIVNLPYDYEKFDLVNFSKYPIYLDSPINTYTNSNYINPVVQLTIQKIK